MPPPRRILHLDVDAFLASVEQAVHPELAGLPVVIGGAPTSRNLVMSCSYEARRFGVRPGMLLAVAAKRCPRAVFRDGDSQAANRLREAATRLLLEYTPKVEVASIDDFFLDLTGSEPSLGRALDVAAAIRARVWSELALPLTIGIANTRMLARVAGKLAKPGAAAEILPGHEATFLTHLPVSELPGVGHAIGAHLERFAIRTVGQLRLVSREILFASFGRDGLVLFDRARGIDETPIEATHVLAEDGTLTARPPRSIQRLSTFEPEEGRRELVLAMLGYLVERAAFQLRRHRSRARAVEARISYVDTRPSASSLPSAQREHPSDAHEPSDAQRELASDAGEHDASSSGLSFARRKHFSAPTDSTDEIRGLARELFEGLPRRRALVKRVGIALHGLVPSDGCGWQGRLFSDPDSDRSPLARTSDARARSDRASELPAHDEHARVETGGARGSRADRQRRLDEAVDRLRERLGFGRVLSAASLELARTHPLTRDGLRLRTPSLNQ